MYFTVSLYIAIGLTALSILSNAALFIAKKNSPADAALPALSLRCRWIGVLYYVFAWFMGAGSQTGSGKTPYEEVAYWLMLSAIGWFAVFVLSIIARLWQQKDLMSIKALGIGTVFFIIAYLLH